MKHVMPEVKKKKRFECNKRKIVFVIIKFIFFFAYYNLQSVCDFYRYAELKP